MNWEESNFRHELREWTGLEIEDIDCLRKQVALAKEFYAEIRKQSMNEFTLMPKNFTKANEIWEEFLKLEQK